MVEKLEDILTRFGNKVADDNKKDTAGQGAQPSLLPDRHPVRDFFVADILEWALKDDRASMEHPFFSLSKKKKDRLHTRHYEHNGAKITITASAEYGLATIWDKDVLIYAISQIVAAINQGQPVSRKVRLKAYDLLVATNRHTGGKNYDRLLDALRRLHGTRVETNIVTNGKRVRRAFGLLDNWETIEKTETGRMISVEITLNEWLFNAAVAREVLTLNRDYFRLNGGLERRLYELARKHCGQQPSWSVSLELLHKKSGAGEVLWKFRESVKKAASRNVLPDYRLCYEPDTDQAVFTSVH